MTLWPEDPIKRCVVVGAIAGVVLELALVGGFFFSRWLPESGLEPGMHRTIELLPFVLVGGAAFLAGIGAFGLAIALALWPRPLPSRGRPPARAAGRARSARPRRPRPGVSDGSGGRPTRGRRS